MADTYTKVTEVSWFSRIKESFKGIVVGLIMFIASFPLLFWNEGRSVKTAKSLAEGAAAVVSIKADKVDPANEKKLVHLSGLATTNEILTDGEFGISAQGIKLLREVEMYQWKEEEKRETRKKMGGGEETITTYSYQKEWSKSVNNSQQFDSPAEHTNPAEKPFADDEKLATHVTLEAFTLSDSLAWSIDTYETLAVSQETADKLPERLKARVKLYNGMFYAGNDPASPQIGDARIKFKVVKPTTVSIISTQVGNTFEPYQTQAGDTIALLYPGVHSAAEMFASEQKQNTIITWLLRLLGWFLMFMGMNLVFKPLSVLGDVIPLVGNILGAGISLVSGLVAVGLSLITIAIAWLYYRPVLGIALLAAGIGAFVLLKKKMSKTKVEVPAAAAPKAA